MVTLEHLKEVERQLHSLLAAVADEYSEEDLRFIMESIAASEYGVALEEFVALAVQRQQRPSADVLTAVWTLARLMKIEDSKHIRRFYDKFEIRE